MIKRPLVTTKCLMQNIVFVSSHWKYEMTCVRLHHVHTYSIVCIIPWLPIYYMVRLAYLGTYL